MRKTALPTIRAHNEEMPDFIILLLATKGLNETMRYVCDSSLPELLGGTFSRNMHAYTYQL